MPTIRFATKLRDDGSLAIPREAVEELSLHPGDEVQVSVESTGGRSQTEDDDQAALQAKFERFFHTLDTLTFERPARSARNEPAGIIRRRNGREVS